MTADGREQQAHTRKLPPKPRRLDPGWRRFTGFLIVALAVPLSVFAFFFQVVRCHFYEIGTRTGWGCADGDIIWIEVLGPIVAAWLGIALLWWLLARRPNAGPQPSNESPEPETADWIDQCHI